MAKIPRPSLTEILSPDYTQHNAEEQFREYSRRAKFYVQITYDANESMNKYVMLLYLCQTGIDDADNYLDLLKFFEEDQYDEIFLVQVIDRMSDIVQQGFAKMNSYFMRKWIEKKAPNEKSKVMFVEKLLRHKYYKIEDDLFTAWFKSKGAV